MVQAVSLHMQCQSLKAHIAKMKIAAQHGVTCERLPSSLLSRPHKAASKLAKALCGLHLAAVPDAINRSGAASSSSKAHEYVHSVML